MIDRALFTGCAEDLQRIAALALRDAATLTRISQRLLGDQKKFGRAVGNLRKYVDDGQHGATEVAGLIETMDLALQGEKARKSTVRAVAQRCKPVNGNVVSGPWGAS